MDTSACFQQYERLMSERIMNLPFRDFSEKNTGREVVALVKKSLGIADTLIPVPRTETVRTVKKSSFEIRLLKAETWPGIFTAANLYIPGRRPPCGKFPLVMICCGHAGHGKLDRAYQTMAVMLAARGAAVLVADNIGQGERVAMGHFNCPGVFASGLSLQGLIVMEALGWLRWASAQDFVDVSRIGATGNSGGGTQTLFLCALSPELSAACPTGYPSTFDFIARKEKRHCDCNIIPRCLGYYEMWDVLGCFAPKPLLLLQGVEDSLFPDDIFYYTARKTREKYRQLGAEYNFDARSLPGLHSWDADRRQAIADFFQKTFSLDVPARIVEDDLLTPGENSIFAEWPDTTLNTEQLAYRLSGREAVPCLSFEEVFKPRYEPDTGSSPLFREVTAQRVLAQFEAFLGD